MNVLPLTKEREVEAVLAAVNVLKKGGVVIIPTDTVYGLAADALNEAAVERVFTIKMRNDKKPLPVLVSDFEMLQKVAVADEKIQQAVKEYGSVTAVLPSRGWVPLSLRAGQLTVGVRIPQDSFVLQVIKGFGGPITGTSANLSGRPSHSKVQDVIDEFEGGEEPDLIIDAGDLPERSPSAVIDFTKHPPRVLRTGPLPKEVLMKLLQGQ